MPSPAKHCRGLSSLILPASRLEPQPIAPERAPSAIVRWSRQALPGANKPRSGAALSTALGFVVGQALRTGKV